MTAHQLVYRLGKLHLRKYSHHISTKISLQRTPLGLLRPLRTCKIIWNVKARRIPQIKTCQSQSISLFCSFSPKIRTGSSVMQDLTTVGQATKRKQEHSLTLHSKSRARELQRKKARRIEKNQRKSPSVTRTLHALRFIIWVGVQMWCWTMRYGSLILTLAKGT